MPYLHQTGELLAHTIGIFIHRHPEVLNFVDSIGDKQEAHGAQEHLLARLREELAAALGAPPPIDPVPHQSPWRADL
eukprot:4915815-Heterocapsa_arctica.AAC.1